MNAWLARITLRRPLSRHRPDEVPLGEAGRDMDCYEVAVVDDNERRHLIVTSVCAQGLLGYLPGNRAEACSPFRLIRKRELQVRHFFRGDDIHFETFADYLLTGFTRIYRLQLAYRDVRQFLFNLRRAKYLRQDRMKVLNFLVEEAIKNRTRKYSAVSVMAEADIRLFLHPNRQELGNYYALIMESLCASEDLLKAGDMGDYKLAPIALKTVADHELDDRRHRDMRLTQWVLAILTLVLAVAEWKSLHGLFRQLVGWVWSEWRRF